MSDDHEFCLFMDTLPALIMESFEQALSASDYQIALRLLKTLEKYLINEDSRPELRLQAVSLLVDAHRRLLERQVIGNIPPYMQSKVDYGELTWH
jgi:hypothetical protein